MVDRLIALWRDNTGLPLDVFLRDAPVLAHSIDKNGRLLNVSALWAQELRYEPTEMIGRKSIEFLTPESRRAAVKRHLPDFYKAGVMRDVPYTFQRSDGSLCNVVMSAGSISKKGKFERSLAVIFKSDESHPLRNAKLEFARAFAEMAASEDAEALRIARNVIADFIDDK